MEKLWRYGLGIIAGMEHNARPGWRSGDLH